MVAAKAHAPDDGEIVLVDNILWGADGIVSCTAAGTDNGAYSLSGYKLPSTGKTYKIKVASIPTYLTSADVQAAINASFATVDGTTSKTLFTNGGTTTAKVGTKDGTNTIGFSSLGNGIVGQAVAWVDSKTKTITEFDITLATAYTWSTNAGKSGDCGGSSTAFDVQNIATHEAGHATGLNDKGTAADHAQTMYGYSAKDELLKRTLANGDRAGIIASYGS
jgi:hypothetical protein